MLRDLGGQVIKEIVLVTRLVALPLRPRRAPALDQRTGTEASAASMKRKA
jgi:hypothetical protein